jgi:hypothetical protein
MIRKYFYREINIYKHCLITYFLALFLTLFIATFLSSCSEFNHSTGIFIVDGVGFNGKTWGYRATPISGYGSHYWDSDKNLNYNLGDTLYLSGCRQPNSQN